MSIYENYNIEIDEKEIIRLLGYKNSLPSEEALNAVRAEIDSCLNHIQPKVAYKRININKIEGSKVFLQNNVVLEGDFIAEKLYNCQSIIACIATLGDDIDRIIRKSFENDNMLQGMTEDYIANCALSNLSKSFWLQIVESIKDTNLGITKALYPGDAAWPISEQKKLFDCVPDSDAIGVTLLDSHFMLPIKSVSAVYGLGEGIGIARVEHICSDCSLKNCSYRIKKQFEVIVHDADKTVSIKAEEQSNLLEVLRKNSIFANSPCGGKGSCGKCRVTFIKGCPPPSVQDKQHLSNKELTSGVRLACTVKVENSMELIVKNQNEAIEIMTSGKEKTINLNPLIKKLYLSLPSATAEDPRSDHKRLSDALGIEDLVVDYKLLPHISSLIRESDFKVTATLYNNTLIHLEADNTVAANYGAAIDIGTTTIACYLINLNDGTLLDVESQLNKQAAYGSDVISRISFTMEDDNGTKLLQSLLIEQINMLLDCLCKRNNISSNNLYNVAIAGNTTMVHFTLGLPTRNISTAPFVPVLTSALDYRGEELGIKINGLVSIMPGIASYVGSDITAGILVSEISETDKYSLLLDLGTNGEIVLGNKDRLLCCATAAGPAFEGSNIKCGIGGVRGSINTISLDNETIYSTIGSLSPIGICGSAVLDIVSEFLKYGIIDKTGRMQGEEDITNTNLKERMNYSGPIKEFIIENSSPEGTPIVFTQKDLREVQMAKSAIASGIEILIKEAGIGYDDIENVYIAGGFGSFMNIESAVNIGLLPKQLRERIISIGNAAGTGAKLYLLSDLYRKKANETTQLTQYIELSTRPDFQDYYMKNMMF